MYNSHMHCVTLRLTITQIQVCRRTNKVLCKTFFLKKDREKKQTWR